MCVVFVVKVNKCYTAINIWSRWIQHTDGNRVVWKYITECSYEVNKYQWRTLKKFSAKAHIKLYITKPYLLTCIRTQIFMLIRAKLPGTNRQELLILIRKLRDRYWSSNPLTSCDWSISNRVQIIVYYKQLLVECWHHFHDSLHEIIQKLQNNLKIQLVCLKRTTV